MFALADELTSGTGARAAATGDFDRDGKPDFATGNESAGTVTVFRNSPLLARAAYAFSRIPLVEGGANIGTSVIVRDMNHNGVPDVVAGNTVTLDGDRARSTLPLPEHTAIKDVTVLDFNGDGHPDVAVLINSYDPETSTSFDGYDLFTGDGAGNFTNAGKVGGLEYSLGIRTADMNRDGWDDLVVASRSGTNVHQSNLYVLINGRTTAGWTVRRTLLTGNVFAMAIGDVTSDGKLDVVLSLQNETSITVEIGNGFGGFSNEAGTSIANSGWGWEDDGWGAVNRNGVTLRFPNPEWQRIRIQTREDGFSIDQIVLSATSYKTQRPGSAKNDTTILQRTQY